MPLPGPGDQMPTGKAHAEVPGRGDQVLGGPPARAAEPGTAGWRQAARRGTVEVFDEHRGTGIVRGDDGSRVMFHCTALADGSRSVASGVVVSFTVLHGHHGQMQAVGLRVDG